MKLLAILLFFSFSALAEPNSPSTNVDVENGLVDLSADTRKPNIGPDRVVDKMAHLPDLVDQEKFLEQIGFNEDWPTPDQVDEKIAKMKIEEENGQQDTVKMRGPASHAQLLQKAGEYRDIYNQFGDIQDYKDPENSLTRANPRHLAGYKTHCLNCGTRYSPNPVAPDPSDSGNAPRSAVDGQ